MSALQSFSRLITISPLECIDALYPYYIEGWFAGIPEGLSPNGFYELIESASTFVHFYVAHCNGELVCVFECRMIPSDPIEYETHANWLTDSRRIRAMTLDQFLSQTDKRLVTFVRPDESDGHFAFARRGKMNYLGETQNMHIFRSW